MPLPARIIDRAIARAARLLPPRLGLALEASRAFAVLPDLRVAAALCDPRRLALDIGANRGLFAWTMARHARACIAFEPNPDIAARFARALPAIDRSNVTLHRCALGDAEGEAVLSIPVVDGVAYAGYGSLARGTALQGHPHREVAVPVRRLDGFALENVGMVKIDVEGFEERVLAGGEETIRRDRPNLLVECEERHNPGGPARLKALLARWGYGDPEPVAGADNNLVFRPGTP